MAKRKAAADQRVDDPKNTAAAARKGDAFKTARSLMKDFLANLPPAASVGTFQVTPRERWHGRRFNVPDGLFAVAKGAWVLRFRGKAFVEAYRRERWGMLGDEPRKVV